MEYVLDSFYLNFVIATVLPMLVALITNKVASGNLKSLVLLALSAINGALVTIQVGDGVFNPKVLIPATIVSFVTSVGVHYGLLKPTGVTGSESTLASTGLNLGSDREAE